MAKAKNKDSEPKKLPKKKSNGIRTAVKYGEISPELALHRLEEESDGYIGEKILGWLQRQKKKKNKLVEPVEEYEDGDS